MNYTIHFDQLAEPSEDESLAAYAPGDLIEGTISWSIDEPPEKFSVSLLFESRGKGTPQREVYQLNDNVAPNKNGKFPFSFTAPDWPWSFSGKLISLLWILQVTDESSNDASEANIIISPTRAEMDLYAYSTDEIEADAIGKGWRRSQRLSVLRSKRR